MIREMVGRAISAIQGRVSRHLTYEQGIAVTDKLVRQGGIEDAIAILEANMTGGTKLPLTITKAKAKKKYYRWQYAAATAVAEAMMMVELFVQELKGEEWERAPEHPLTALLHNPNWLVTGPEFRFLIAADLMLVGESFWEVVRNGLSEPAELWPLVGKVSPKFAADRQTLGGWTHKYKTDKGAERTEHYEPEDVVYLRLPRPGYIIGSMGPGEAAAAAESLDEKIIQAEWSAFKEGIFPRTILKMSGRDPKQRRETLDKFEDRYGGVGKKTIGIGPNMEVIFPDRKPTDMGFPEGSNRVRDSILATFRVPEAVLGIATHVSRAAAEAIEYIFAKHRISPLIRMVAARLTQDLAARFYGPGVRVWHENPVPADRQMELREVEIAAKWALMSPNGIRAKYFGLKPVTWGDYPFLPRGYAQVGPNGEIEAMSPKVPATKQILAAPSRVELGHSAKTRRAIAFAFQTHRQQLEDAYRDAASSFFGALGEELMEAFEAAHRDGELEVRQRITQALPLRVNKLVDPLELAKRIAAHLLPLNRRGLFIGGSFDQSLLGDRSQYPWTPDNDAIRRYAAEYSSTHYMDVARTTRQQYVDVVAQAVVKDAAWDEVRLGIVKQIGIMTESRAGNIAATETTRLYGAGGQAFREHNELLEKQWVTSFVNSRDTHVDADGQVVKNNELFSVGTDRMLFPGDGSEAKENCWCSCVAAAFVKKL